MAQSRRNIYNDLRNFSQKSAQKPIQQQRPVQQPKPQGYTGAVTEGIGPNVPRPKVPMTSSRPRPQGYTGSVKPGGPRPGGPKPNDPRGDFTVSPLSVDTNPFSGQLNQLRRMGRLKNNRRNIGMNPYLFNQARNQSGFINPDEEQMNSIYATSNPYFNSFI
tara:strand:- start:8984 stop:9469 length:486 start_codon:yes stop_codon:yes gene_type:complete